MTGSAVGAIVGIPLSGWVFHRTGSYEWARIACLVALLLATLLTALVRTEPYHGQFVSEGGAATSAS